MNRRTAVALAVALAFGAGALRAQSADAATLLCHNPGPTQNTMSVNDNAVAAHLGHGDYLGACNPLPTATPLPTAIPTDEPTATAEPPSPTPMNTLEPTATWTVEPTFQAPTPTAGPQEAEREVVIAEMWFLTSDSRWCVILSFSHPSVERQEALCGTGWNSNPYNAEARCAGPVWSNDVWACDKLSLEWRMHRWPDAGWLHGLGRLHLDELCSRYPEYCDG